MRDLSHLDAKGKARMVDVGDKAVTKRRAVAEAWVDLGVELLEKVLSGATAKGDAFAVARLAGIQAAKRTADWIPLCHVLPLDVVSVDLEADRARGSVRVTCAASAEAKTGVEMEALVGAAAASLALYDMCKAANPAIRVDGLRLLRKEGGRSGSYQAPDAAPGRSGS
jgi:cyclic pyranopterin phosphate synthase